jgi:hypothetical protein
MTVLSSLRARTGWTKPNWRMLRSRESSSSSLIRRGLAGSGRRRSIGTSSTTGRAGESGPKPCFLKGPHASPRRHRATVGLEEFPDGLGELGGLGVPCHLVSGPSDQVLSGPIRGSVPGDVGRLVVTVGLDPVCERGSARATLSLIGARIIRS